jgi:monothiol glutaredoxin
MSETMTAMTEEEILAQIKRETAENRVFLYMKGTPEMPRCGFSNQVVQILNHTGVEYGARDILPDPRIRQVLSSWSEWPTIPQLFVDGKLVGGCDIVTEMFQDGELEETLRPS